MSSDDFNKRFHSGGEFCRKSDGKSFHVIRVASTEHSIFVVYFRKSPSSRLRCMDLISFLKLFT